MMLIAPEARAGVVVLINSDSIGASELASHLLEIVLGLPPGDHKEITVDPKLYDGYVGNYEVTSVVIGIVREGDQLFALINGHKNEIFPESARGYFFKAFDSQITFVTGEMYRRRERHAPIVIRMAGASGDDDPLPIPAVREVVRRAAQA